MKRLTTLTVRSYLGPFFATFFIVQFILIMQFLWKYIDELVGKGLDFTVILELLFYASATLVPMALPLSILLAAVMTFGNLAEKYELVAFKAAGLSLLRIMRPLIMVIILISGLAFYFSAEIMPLASYKMKSLLTDVRAKKPALDIVEKVYYKGIDGFVLRVEQKDEETQELKGVTIYDHRKEPEKDGQKKVYSSQSYNNKVIYADHGYMEVAPDFSKMRLKLYDGYRFHEERGQGKVATYPLYRSEFDTANILFSLEGFDFSRNDHEKHKNRSHSMTITQLDSMITHLEDKVTLRREDHVNHLNSKVFYLKDSLAFSSDTLAQDTIGFMDHYTEGQQRSIVATAINLSRTARAFNRSMVKEFETHKKTTNSYLVEWHRKWTLSVACIVLFFIGAPMGAIIKKGGLGLPVIVSVSFFLVYYVLSIVGEKSVKQGAMEAIDGMWLATGALAPIGLFLMYMASTDSPIMDMETYVRLFNRLIRRRS